MSFDGERAHEQPPGDQCGAEHGEGATVGSNVAVTGSDAVGCTAVTGMLIQGSWWLPRI